jgi:hypothetical protein
MAMEIRNETDESVLKIRDPALSGWGFALQAPKKMVVVAACSAAVFSRRRPPSSKSYTVSMQLLQQPTIPPASLQSP